MKILNLSRCIAVVSLSSALYAAAESHTVSVSNTSCGVVEVTWTGVDGADGYRVRRKVVGDAVYTNIGDVSKNARTFSDVSVTENVEYQYVVRPLNNGVASGTSSTPRITHQCESNTGTGPDIADLKAKLNACQGVELTWTGVSNADAYRVRRKKINDATYTILKDVSSSTESYTDTAVSNNTNYIYMVRPMTDGTASGISNTPSVVYACDPDNGGENEPSGSTLRKNANNSFSEKNGLVIIEAESTDSPLDQWVKKKSVNGYAGNGHFEFTGNTQKSGPAASPLEYTFKVNKTGLYGLVLRAHKRLEGAPSDQSNDCYVRVQGDYGAHPDAGNNHQDYAPLAELQRNRKLFGGAANGWGYTSAASLDMGGHDNKRKPVYAMKAGESYTLTLSGRSQNFNLDRIVFYNTANYTLDDIKQTVDTPETVQSGSIPAPSANR